jgi:hypothetical protein
MQLGMHLRELWSSKLGIAIAVLVALLAATRVMYGISVFPPGLERHSLDIASASTRVLVDTPRSTTIDLRQNVYEIESLSQRAVILGNVIGSPPVRSYIARQVGVSPDRIEVTPPLTPSQPRAIAGSENAPHTSDILKSPDEYRLNIQANPTVPVLDVYAQAPDAEAAKDLANQAIAGLQRYLDSIAAQRGTPPEDQVRLEQLGQPRSGVINQGAGLRLASVVFVLVFAICCAAVLFVARVRRGWAAVEEFETPPAPGAA